VDERLQDGSGLGALERDQRAVLEDVPLDTVSTVLGAVGIDLGLEVGQVLGAAASVGHEVEAVFAAAGDDGVVYDATSADFQKAGQGGCVGGKLVQRRGSNLHE
jgi:hypothetical protein